MLSSMRIMAREVSQEDCRNATSVADLKAECPTQYYYNKLAADLASAFLIATSVLYAWNSACALWEILQERDYPRKRRPRRLDVSVNSLSGLLTSGLALVFIFGTVSVWPQPLESAALMLIALTQASTLGWQQHDPEGVVRDMIDKVPDSVGVGVSIYTLGKILTDFLGFTKERFKLAHNPSVEINLSWTLLGLGVVVGFVQEVWFSRVPKGTRGMPQDLVDQRRMKRRLTLQSTSILFTLSQLVVVPALIFGSWTITPGYKAFNRTKVCALVTVGLGFVYSLLLSVLRIFVVWDPEPDQ